VPPGPAALNLLLEEFIAPLTTAFETMAGERPVIEYRSGSDAPQGGLTWQQAFTGTPGEVWLNAADSDVAAIGGYLLLAAGVGDSDAETAKSTYLETLSQALGGLAQALSGRLKREVTPRDGREAPAAEGGSAPPAAAWAQAEIKLPERTAALHIGFAQALLDTLAAAERPAVPSEALPREFPAAAEPLTSRTFDLLLDVELPVSVSFGRAQLQLKDVLKLTTGSIIELNRSVVEPVEVIVNNCVIARGEVVVVEGNFGVRIQQVISRQERLRTLN
jgi:flagellar motor switch protein FliN/FliY